uniref:Uncharacterized protein n=1 Tax=Pararge aegeria TaxID=116150 RepID=S4PHM3_9NEOP
MQTYVAAFHSKGHSGSRFLLKNMGKNSRDTLARAETQTIGDSRTLLAPFNINRCLKFASSDKMRILVKSGTYYSTACQKFAIPVL